MPSLASLSTLSLENNDLQELAGAPKAPQPWKAASLRQNTNKLAGDKCDILTILVAKWNQQAFYKWYKKHYGTCAWDDAERHRDPGISHY